MRWARPVVLGLVVAAVASCKPYEKEVASNPFFSGMEGASGPGLSGSDRPAPRDPRHLEPDQQREVAEDGTITLRAKGPRHLMRHIFETLRNGERELFTEQVLSEATRQEFVRNGKDPGEAFDMLSAELEMIDRLFARMPMAENAPNARYERIGPGMNRLRLIRGVGRDLKWQGFDMITEDGLERLLWFYEER